MIKPDCWTSRAVKLGRPRGVTATGGATHAVAFGTYLGLDRFLAQAVSRGSTPFAIASVDGGRSYWHPRASGEDAGAMVTDEFIPLLASQGLDTSRVAILGWSMGGYGALHIASRLGAGRVAAVVAESPALWFSAGGHTPSYWRRMAAPQLAFVAEHLS